MAKAGAHRKQRRSPRPQPAKPPEPEPKLPSPTSCVAQPCACLKAEDPELILCRAAGQCRRHPPTSPISSRRCRRAERHPAAAAAAATAGRGARPAPGRRRCRGSDAPRSCWQGRCWTWKRCMRSCRRTSGPRRRRADIVMTAQTDRATDGFVLAVRAICVRLMESRAVSPVWAGGNDRSLLIRLSSNTWLPSSERPGGIDQSSAGRRAASLCCATAPTLAARLVAAPPPAA